MDNLWAWFKRANAKAVLAAAVVVLAVAIGWWTWKTLTPIAFAPPVLPPASPANPPPPIGLLAYIEKEGTLRMQPTDTTLFALPDFLKPKPPESIAPDTQPKPPESQKPKPTPPPAPTPAPQPASTPAPQPPKRDVLDLTYRGLYQSSDGGLMALIEDSKSHSASFYTNGATVFGLAVSNVAPEELTVTTADGTARVLKRGANVRFSDGRIE